MKTVREDAPTPPSIPRVKKEQSHKKPSEESLKLIQKQLVLLLHAHACLKKDLILTSQCTVPNCSMMRGVWQHIKECKTGPECPHLHCLSSLKILAHWKHCKDEECTVCKLVRQKGAQQVQLQLVQQQFLQPQGEGGVMVGAVADSRNISPQMPNCNKPTLGQSTLQPDQGLLSQCQGQAEPGNVAEHHHYHSHINCPNYNYTSLSHNPFHKTYNWQRQNHNASAILKDALRGPMQMSHFYSAVLPPQPQFAQYEYPSFAQPHTQAPFPFLLRQTYPGGGGIFRDDFPGGQQGFEDFMISLHKPPPNAFNYEPAAEISATSLPVPSANDVRRAYEQLGIPCPADALKRLMATLPGGSRETAEMEDAESDSRGGGIGGVTISRVRDSIDTDDGINDSMSVEGEEHSWCTSLVHRLNLSGKRQQIVASDSY